MEYSWAFAAARTPIPGSYYQQQMKKKKQEEQQKQQQQAQNPQATTTTQRPDRPTRSNSTSGARPRRKPLIPGHSRASSCSSSTSHSIHDVPLPEVHQQYHHDAAPGGVVPSHAARPGTRGGGTSSSGEHRRPPKIDLHHALFSNHQLHPYVGHGQVPLKSQRPDRAATAQNNQYYHNKQLPATPPHLDTDSNSSITPTTAAAADATDTANAESDSGSARGQASGRLPRPLSLSFPPHTPTWTSAATTSHYDRRMFQHAAMFTDSTISKISGAAVGPSTRADSVVSSTSGATTLSSRTMLSSETPWSAESAAAVASNQPKLLVVRNGRTYLSDPTLPYPLPVDLAELHRQSLRTLLVSQLFCGPICSPEFANKPPRRVLEVGCGSGFWSMTCYHHYAARFGHSDISFTGIDIAPITPGAPGQGGTGTRHSAGTGGRGGSRTASTGTSASDGRPYKDMKWRFVQHDMRKVPWPFHDGEFDLVMVKDMSFAMQLGMQQALMDEHLRVLSPGGTLEIWESDHTIRMLRPHVPEQRQARQAAAGADDSSSGDASSSEEDEEQTAVSLGAYVMTGNTPMSAPLNNYLVEYNGWVSKALEARGLSALPCTLMGPLLLQEAETLTAQGSRRLAVPLSEARWEREGVGGVVTKDGKSYIETTKNKSGRGGTAAAAATTKGGGREAGGRPLTAAQTALRRTALTTVVQQIQSLELMLRDVNDKSQDEWDSWVGKMMNDLMQENGTSWGECLEIGAWWAKKRS